jgi:hypothetical protein
LPPDAAPPTIGDVFPELTQLVVVVNLSDGFMTPYADDRYSVDFVTGKASFNDATPIDVEPSALQATAALVRRTPYRTINTCLSCFIDGSPYPPSIVASSPLMTKEFGASDQQCAPTDHDVYGDVVTCSDFQALHAAVLELLGLQSVA